MPNGLSDSETYAKRRQLGDIVSAAAMTNKRWNRIKELIL